MSKFNWDPALNTKAVVNYLKSGFGFVTTMGHGNLRGDF
jgi:hypothetical protein